MAIKKTEEFCPADRYKYDWGLPGDFAQIDTEQDAEYFGTWASAQRLVIFCYCEGDCTTTECDTAEEFRSEILKIKQWNEKQGLKFRGIDPGLKPERKQLWIDAGLENLLH